MDMGPPTSSVRVRLFGSVRFEDHLGVARPLASGAQRRLTAVLALAQGGTRRAEHLAELLSLSAGGLRASVCRLRGRLGAEVVRTEGSGYRLVVAVDVADFESLLAGGEGDRLAQLDAALGLAREDLLDEFRHEAWALPTVARIDEMRRTAVEERAEVLVARGAPDVAVAALEEHIALHPLRDRAWCVLVRALAADGRQADALRAVQAYRRLLAEETGTEPSAAVRAVERQVATGAGRPRLVARPRPRPRLADRPARRRGHCGVDRRRRHGPPRRRPPAARNPPRRRSAS